MIVDELRALAAGAVTGAVVPPSSHVRDVTTRAADRLELLEHVRAAAVALITNAIDASRDVELEGRRRLMDALEATDA